LKVKILSLLHFDENVDENIDENIDETKSLPEQGVEITFDYVRLEELH